MYMSAWRELEDMVTYRRGADKYFTGKQIKDIIEKCLNEGYYGCYMKTLNNFKETYMTCQYPLSNNGMYQLRWNREDYSKLKCYKRKDV